ncbi:hypothetical protein Zmor_007884 [Zophobas morio]|uniref:Odorant receptor n=1 Tax=Zophobas morio TaxID=2755281 RepID=A0AA38ITI4_9CUCU|nr:hypothetical protein Zmor_007884 [Zophobas morio]
MGYDWNSTLKLHIVSLKILGLWPHKLTYKFNLYAIWTFLLFTTFIICHCTFQAINLYLLRDDLSAVVGIFYILLIKILSFFKGYYLIKNTSLLNDVLQILEDDIFQPKNTSQEEMVKSNVGLWKIFRHALVFTYYGCNSFFAIYPLFDKTEERRLPFLAWYPYDSQASPAYEITYVYQVLAVVYNTSVHLHVDSLVCVFNMYAACQFEILTDNLKTFVKENENVVGENNRLLLKCVQHHKSILEYIQKCNVFFNWIVFFQFFVSSISIGITMYHLTLVVPLSNQFNSLILYWSAIVVQIFLYCFFGNEVQVTSDKLSYAAFESNWMELSVATKKMLIFFTMNLQKPVQLSALDLFYLTLDTFMRIMKTAWSYFAFLHQVGN